MCDAAEQSDRAGIAQVSRASMLQRRCEKGRVLIELRGFFSQHPRCLPQKLTL
jgi:hypothetical protein